MESLAMYMWMENTKGRRSWARERREQGRYTPLSGGSLFVWVKMVTEKEGVVDGSRSRYGNLSITAYQTAKIK